MIAIKGREMPSCCYECIAKKHCGVGIADGWRTDKRADDCPLIEIEQSEDCVSRQAVIKELNDNWLSGTCARRIIDEQIDKIKALPPVTPTLNITELDKLDKIEQIVKKELSPLSLDEMSNAEIQIREILEKE